MHDIDRTWKEFTAGERESGETSFEFDPEVGFGGEIASPFHELQEMELAAELLTVNSEAELNHFLGNLIRKAGSAVGSFVSSPTGQALGGILKQAAKRALPVVGSAIGGYFGGTGGAKTGAKWASSAGNLLGLELEGVNQEDEAFETARQFVKFGGAAVSKAVQASPGTPPNAAVKQAVAAAAQKYLPGVVGGQEPQQGGVAPGRSGRWYRRGNKVILVGI